MEVPTVQDGNDGSKRTPPLHDSSSRMCETSHCQSSYSTTSSSAFDGGGETPDEYSLYAGSSTTSTTGKKRNPPTKSLSNLDTNNNNNGNSRTCKKRSPSDTDEMEWNSGSTYTDNDQYEGLDYGGVYGLMDACITQVQSPDAIMEDKNASIVVRRDYHYTNSPDDEDAEESEHPGKNQGALAGDNHTHRSTVNELARGENDDLRNENRAQVETPWEGFCMDVGNATDILVPNLQAYITAKDHRYNVRAEFEEALGHCMENLKSVTDALLDLGVSICEEKTSHLEDIETEVTSMFMSNHNRRKNCLSRIHQADTNWKQDYSTLITNVLAQRLHDEDDPDFVGRQQRTDKDYCSQDEHDSHTLESTTDSNPNLTLEHSLSTNKAETDWEEICDNYEPSRNNVTAFLEAREARRGAMNDMQDFNDEIHATIRNDVLDSILQIALNLHQDLEPPCLDLEEEIEAYLMQNHRRRQELREKLFESEQQAQGLFATLQARLSQQH